jgi:hypothetical protein
VGEAKKIARVVGSAKCVCGVTLGALFFGEVSSFGTRSPKGSKTLTGWNYFLNKKNVIT